MSSLWGLYWLNLLPGLIFEVLSIHIFGFQMLLNGILLLEGSSSFQTRSWFFKAVMIIFIKELPHKRKKIVKKIDAREDWGKGVIYSTQLSCSSDVGLYLLKSFILSYIECCCKLDIYRVHNFVLCIKYCS